MALITPEPRGTEPAGETFGTKNENFRSKSPYPLNAFEGSSSFCNLSYPLYDAPHHFLTQSRHFIKKPRWCKAVFGRTTLFFSFSVGVGEAISLPPLRRGDSRIARMPSFNQRHRPRTPFPVGATVRIARMPSFNQQLRPRTSFSVGEDIILPLFLSGKINRFPKRRSRRLRRNANNFPQRPVPLRCNNTAWRLRDNCYRKR